MTTSQSICVFCGSSTGTDPVYADIANELGKEFAKAGIKLVFGGGHIGLMGVVADAVLEDGGDVIGVIPESLQMRELAHPGVQDMRIVDSMHTRKALMAELANAFVALPGGLGTFEELCEILTWAQLSFHDKPVVILNVNNYYDSLLAMIDHGIREGFMKPKHRELFHVADSVAELMKLLNESDSGSSDAETLFEKT
ncbi:TIGR00730 family Rossman fold protein [Planctomicrobium sp.]|jgi:uncharacterized protein (TIGR00730 family)|nr:TIGR00730 family Rossman fold protein [Planctomicrobium sp.]MBT5018280.1 TIGR00730 family Rossman fold protein [Planctomicrobium sp.]MDA7528092.1 TIGR00730 family Rossman fold protein [bacterium]MDB4733528.1 TIGR00730 family Rossman fold protein [Planctomicrobium sp.]